MVSLIPPVIHPLVVHFAVALLPVAALLATMAATRRWAWTVPAARLVLLLGLLGAGAAVATGLLAFDAIEDDLEGTPAGEVGETHEVLGISTLVSFGGLWALSMWRRGVWLAGRWRWGFVALAWAAVALLVVTAWYGGALVYEYGVPERPPA